MSFEYQISNCQSKSQASQTIRLILKRAWSFDVNISWNIYILSIFFLLAIVFIYLQYILTVHTLMFIVKPYLFICTMYSYSFGFWVSIHSFLQAWCIFRSVSIRFFFSLKLYQWYAETMILLSVTNNDVEENGRNVSLRALVCLGMKNFSIDLKTFFVNAVHLG